jgi:hypothetical protein
MSVFTYSDPHWNGLKLVTEHALPSDRNGRILTALGPAANESSFVDDGTLYQYYHYLADQLTFPFRAVYPQPATPFEEVLHRASVVELLDPKKYLSDDFSGIFCKTKRGKFEVNLPLVELHVPEDSPNSQLIEDYCHWFWNWRE